MKRNIKLEQAVKRNEELHAAARYIAATGGFWMPAKRYPIIMYEPIR